jgi:F0F1-type ATP synthase epsilon subunit
MVRLFRLVVLTPEEPLLDAGEVAWVQAHLADGGGIGIYPGHAPLVAETVTAPLRYADPAGEHALDLEAGILQVDAEGVTIFTSGPAQTSKASETLEVSEEARFDRLAQALVATMRAQPDGIADLRLEAGEE